jgi:outer membrane protein OmpA-like peptidoglycan-associated protein
MRKIVTAVSVVALALALVGSSACATKKFVNQRVGEVNDKVETLSGSLEETQERTRKNEARIAEVDQKADSASQKADTANQAAAQAHTAAQDARTAADAAGTRVEQVDREAKRLVFEVVLSEDQGNFNFGQADLPDAAKAELDKMVGMMKGAARNYFIEIEGHTDSVGPKEFNLKLGLDRAEAVKRYLYEQHSLPLHKMNVISYGEDRPVSSNRTRTDRAMNRRVVIKVLA